MPYGPFTPVTFADASLAQVESLALKTLRGYSLRETAGSAAVIRLRDGSAAGTILETIRLAANESRADAGLDIATAGGVWMQLVSGTVEGTVRIG